MKIIKTFIALPLHFALLFSLLSLLSNTALSQPAPFGNQDDIAFGDALWDALVTARLAGDDSIMARPYEGTQPHGNKLVTLESDVTVNGISADVIIKHNYGGEGSSIEAVSNDPDKFLMATTVMFRRPGFDADNQDWFWAKYLPDGSYDRAPDGNPLVGKGPGCIACHTAAPGGDMVYLNDRY
ncbi:hypothetical protein N8600_07620 [Gammaproteobacteria bacterium]|nr:hypothetical protein [Gammaproteobacteria bacterium]